MTKAEKLEAVADSYATVCLGVDRNDDMYYGFHAGANWQASQHDWVKCSERLPTEVDEEGKQISYTCFFIDSKGVIHKGRYLTKKFRQCEWDDLDEDNIEDYHVEVIDGEYWLKEGWWEEYEHRGELYENHIHKVVAYIKVSDLKSNFEPPKTEI